MKKDSSEVKLTCLLKVCVLKKSKKSNSFIKLLLFNRKVVTSVFLPEKSKNEVKLNKGICFRYLSAS